MSNLSGDLRLSPSMYFTYAEQNRTFQHLGIWYAGMATVTGAGEPEQVRNLLVSDGVLQALAVQPRLGRWLLAADHAVDAPRDGDARPWLLATALWWRSLGDRPADHRRVALTRGRWRHARRLSHGQRGAGRHRALRIRSQPADVAGFRVAGRRPPEARRHAGTGQRRHRAAGADLDAVVAGAPTIDPRVYESWRITPALRPLAQDVVGNISRALWVLMGTIGIVMVIACANVAGLLLVRTESRQQELAVRAALGAGRGRIIRGLLVESILLGLAGGALGLGVASVGLDILVSRGPDPCRASTKSGSTGERLDLPSSSRSARVSCSDFCRRSSTPVAGSRSRSVAPVGRQPRAASGTARATRWSSLRSRWRSCCSSAPG